MLKSHASWFARIYVPIRMDNEVLKKKLASIRMSAMNILAGREHSVDELRQKLKRKLGKRDDLRSEAEGSHYADGFLHAEGSLHADGPLYADGSQHADGSNKKETLEALIEMVLEQLLEDKLLDEGRFTESFIRSRINNGSGPIKIRHELMNRGIDNELTDDYLDNSYEFWQKHIEAARTKRFGSQYPKDYKEQSRQSRFLYQRGFSGELIQRLFNEFQ
ncbi:MAG: recombination regulator RecX [Gammaproteobacteria bacterium]|nr:recombination regulator RecX [Gammaproteobacteria bacterium]